MKNDMVEEIIEIMREMKSGVSFVDLENRLGAKAKGDYQYEILPNVVLWSGMSIEFASALRDERIRDALEIAPTPLLVYLADGKVLNLPIAKRPPRNGYREPHWAPVTLRLRKNPRTITP